MLVAEQVWALPEVSLYLSSTSALTHSVYLNFGILPSSAASIIYSWINSLISHEV